jgi:hypothetical protein
MTGARATFVAFASGPAKAGRAERPIAAVRTLQYAQRVASESATARAISFLLCSLTRPSNRLGELGWWPRLERSKPRPSREIC